MDTGRGTFTEIDEKIGEEFRKAVGIERSGIFQEGEELEIRGSHFKIESIGRKYMRLKLLKKNG